MLVDKSNKMHVKTEDSDCDAKKNWDFGEANMGIMEIPGYRQLRFEEEETRRRRRRLRSKDRTSKDYL